MKRALILRWAILMAVVCLLVGGQAQAWGPRAMQSINAMSLQMLKGDFPNVFRPGGVVGNNFEKDVMAGARDGSTVLTDLPMNSETEAVQAVVNQILLLREVRKFGPTPYFAYRMGVLASLTAKVMVPYGFAWTPEDKKIQTKIFEDIDAHLDGYTFMPAQESRQFIRDGYNYFKKQRTFYDEDKILIGNDYRGGVGYNGFLKNGGQAYFTRTVQIVADVWNTVLRADESGHGIAQPSPRALTWYFVSEMEYLLKVKRNTYQAEKVYENFEKVNPRIVESYEKVGDLFYAVNTREAKTRGIAEWEKAYSMGGPERARLGKKLSAHHMAEGKLFLDKAAQPGAEDTDLPTALNAFEQAMDYDRTSQEAAQLIQQTNVAIQERNERLEMTINIISTGEKVRAEADNYRDKGDFANAIKTYRQAVGFFEAVDEEFKEQSNTAKENVRRLRKSIQDVINDVMDAASQAIDEGDRAKDGNRFPEAIGAYQRVPTIVSVIPEDEHKTVIDDKNKMVEMSQKKIEEANVAKIRYEQAMAEQARAAQQPGAKPAAGAPAAAPAPAPAAGAPAAAPAVPGSTGLEPSIKGPLPKPNIPGLK